MKIALINPPYRKIMHILNPAFPLGLGYIKAVCKKNEVYCDLFDFSATELSDEELIKKYNLHEYKVMAVSSYSPAFDDTAKFIKRLKNDNNTIIVGGHHISLAKEKILKDFKEVDYGLIGFGEYAFLQFIQNFNAEERYNTPGLCYRDGGSYKINPVDYSNFDLNEIPFIDRSDIIYDFNIDAVDYMSKKVLNISTSRGCPYSCTYCVNCKNNYWLKRNIDNVIKEIEIEYEKNQYNIINFVDCNFFVKPERAHEIIKRVLSFNDKITVNFQTRCDQIVKNKEIVEKLLMTKRCNIVLGIESNSNRVLQRYKKGTNDKINQQAIEIMKKNNIEPSAYIIMFEALESLEDVRANYDFIKSNNLCNFGMISNIYQIIIPFYGSRYYEEYGEYYTNEIHTQASPIFTDKRVGSLYECVKRFQNEYQDRINKVLIRLNKYTTENEFKEDKIFLIKCQYMVFEYLLIMCEKFQVCFYETLKESRLAKMIDETLDKYLTNNRMRSCSDEEINVY